MLKVLKGTSQDYITCHKTTKDIISCHKIVMAENDNVIKISNSICQYVNMSICKYGNMSICHTSISQYLNKIPIRANCYPGGR